MLQRLGMELPDWARATHPHIRYELGARFNVTSRRVKYAQAIGISFVIVLLFVGGYFIGTNFLQNVPGQSLTESAMAIDPLLADICPANYSAIRGYDSDGEYGERTETPDGMG